MECSCDVGVDFDEGPEFYTEKIIKARKQHKCNECRGMINKGEKYERVTGKWDGNVSTYKTCLDCLSIRKQFFSNGWSFSDMLWDLKDHIVETDAGLSQECIAKLTSSARERVCDMIQEHWGRD
jgi:hypothetical protein